MRLRFSAILAATALGLAAALALAVEPAFAQAPPVNPHPEIGPGAKPPWVEPPKDLPKARRGNQSKSLDFLFGALKAAPDEDSAKSIEERIWAQWLASGSDTTNLLMGRAKQAAEAGDQNLAIRLLDAVVEIKPRYVEGWNRRATVFFLKKDYAAALKDLRKVLTLEPRHFGALAGLGLIMQEIGSDKDALSAYRRAVEIYPHLKGMADKIKSLAEKVEGRDI
jgi:tetratricopeptide (TPR) repeat protein